MARFSLTVLALGANISADEAFKKIKKIYGLSFAEAESRLTCFTSIGTGHLGLNETTNDAGEMLRDTTVKVITQTERTARDFEESHFALFGAGRAFRFNVDHGLEKIGLDEWNQLRDIRAKTRNWLGHARHSNEVGLCAKQLANHVGMFMTKDDSLHVVHDTMNPANATRGPWDHLTL